MNRIVLGAMIALALAGLGAFWWQGRAQIERGAPPPVPAEPVVAEPEVPASDPGDMVGPAPPEASELTKEQRRFFRYDRNRDWRITRTEMLSSRTDAFRKLERVRISFVAGRSHSVEIEGSIGFFRVRSPVAQQHSNAGLAVERVGMATRGKIHVAALGHAR